MHEVTVHLSDSEHEALMMAYPDLPPAEAASLFLKSEIARRYRRELKAGRLVDLQGLNRAAGRTA